MRYSDTIFRFAWLFLPALAWTQPAGEILTPKPGPKPAIHSPGVYGARPNRPFLYRIPCTGDRPIRFTAQGLPPGLALDGDTGIITGRTPAQTGRYEVKLAASNRSGRDSRVLRIVVGDQIALTPPMGWNHWYTHYHRINDALMRQAADQMIASGMADFGYDYVSIDDCWAMKPGSSDPALSGPPRDSAGEIQPNRNFPDMPALTSYIHSKGLKAGIYTSPGPKTCAQYEGSWQHESADAKRFSDWGFDLLKYDWCSYGKLPDTSSLEARKKPYSLIGGILARQDRDIVFNLCQYGMSEVWKWGGEVGGQSWRTTGDLGLEKDTRLPGFYSIAFKNAVLDAFAGPGHWNDPDYILIGFIGNARSQNDPPARVKLSAGEQYSYMSLWALMASPLFFSGDMGHLDEFTLNVLCNAEVIGVNQDTLGKQARIVQQTGDDLILAKPLEDGSVAVGLFNLSEAERKMSISWSALGIKGSRTVRDLWRQRNEGRSRDAYESAVGRHGVKLVRLSR